MSTALAILAAAPMVSAQQRDAGGSASGELSADELAVEAPDTLPNPAVTAADAGHIMLEPVVERGYFDEQGRYVIDLMEQDYTYLSVRVLTLDGRPVEEAEVNFSVVGTSQLVGQDDASAPLVSDQFGIVEVAVVGGQMGLDRIAVESGDATTEVLVNVISLRANSFSLPELEEDFLPWDELMRAEVRFEEMTLFAEFPAEISARSGETVKVSGFMMPLETGLTQKWFLLTSHPPGCFFHVPGGPAGAVEVFAEEGIEVAWGPIVLEGEFQALAESESAIYRLDDARVVQP